MYSVPKKPKHDMIYNPVQCSTKQYNDLPSFDPILISIKTKTKNGANPIQFVASKQEPSTACNANRIYLQAYNIIYKN